MRFLTSAVYPARDFSASTMRTSSSVSGFFSGSASAGASSCAFGLGAAFVLVFFFGSSFGSPLAIASASACRLSPKERTSSMTSKSNLILLIFLFPSFDFMNFYRLHTLSRREQVYRCEIPEKQMEKSHRQPAIRAFQYPCPGFFVRDIDADSMFQRHIRYLPFCKGCIVCPLQPYRQKEMAKSEVLSV